MKKMSHKKSNILLISGCALATLTIAANVTAFGFLGYVLDAYFEKGTVSINNTISKEQAKQNARDLCETIEGEGIVLLENKKNALPFTASNINVLGYRSTNIYYGGTGSGSASTKNNITLIQGLKDAGFNVNEKLVSLYGGDKTSSADGGVGNTDFTVNEYSLSKYTGDTSFENQKQFSNTAIVVIGRGGGEGNDLPTNMSKYGGDSSHHYLELSKEEDELISKASATFDKVVVLLNTANAMELGFLNNYDNVSCLWIGQPGSTGCEAVGKVLSGKINPSGRLTDTYAFDALSAPASHDISPVKYDNADGYSIEYTEGIYVGYRYYETAAFENLIKYDETVQYPFGYGLSYTTFEQTITGGTEDKTVISGKEKITLDVKVKNTGSLDGKDVVQAYVTSPYTNNGIEKSYKSLIAFEKVEVESKKEATVTLSFDAEDMASYDVAANNGKGAYVLEKGNYNISIQKNAHEVIDSISLVVNDDVVYSGNNKRSSDNVETENKFSGAKGDLTYLSRKDGFSNYIDATKSISTTASEDTVKALTSESTSSYTNEENRTPLATGVNSNLKFSDLYGADYNDSRWDTLISEMSVKEMQTLIGYGGYATQKVSSIDKSKNLDTDGPAGLSYYMNPANFDTTSFCVEVVVASTFNKDLAYKYGQAVGDEANVWGFTGWYAPGVNTHRTPFGGRNYEYYSEDGLLSGKMAANVIKGAKEKGVVTYVKHFALNDQEDNRTNQVCTWSNEQAIREIYLKPFEIAVKEGGSSGVMTSYNFIGNQWTGGMKELCTDVLRKEWGFKGVVITDYGYGGYNYMNPDKAIRAGNDLMLSTLGLKPTDTSAAGIYYMQQACKHILYSVASVSTKTSNAQSANNALSWRTITYICDAVLGVAAVALITFGILGKISKEKE